MPRTIKIEAAIEVLTQSAESPLIRANPDTKAAMKLGISAMKRIKQIRDSGGDIGMPVLKGETPPERKMNMTIDEAIKNLKDMPPMKKRDLVFKKPNQV